MSKFLSNPYVAIISCQSKSSKIRRKIINQIRLTMIMILYLPKQKNESFCLKHGVLRSSGEYITPHILSELTHLFPDYP